MIKPTVPPSEERRLRELRQHEILDTLPEAHFDQIVRIASQICGTPIALVSLIDENRQWFKAKIGLEAAQTSREISFCGHAIHGREVFEIEDALTDPRFATNPLVIDSPSIRFYAGAPLTTGSGENLGTLCVIDRTPRKLTEDQLSALSALADQTVALIEMRSTERRLRQATEAKSQFLTNMSHEIRTPLGAILGFSEALRDPTISQAERTRYLDVVSRNGQVLSRLIDDILDLSKVEAKKLSVEKVPFCLRELVREVIETLEAPAREKHTSLALEFEDSVPNSIQSDPFRIRQILVNLIGNAVKFTTKGKIEVSVSGQPSREAGEIISIKVKDTGIGIAHEHSALLFQPFGQAQTSTPRNYGGTGLGLYLTRQLCELLGGTLELAESAPGVGSVFVATFKAAAVMSESKPKVRAAPRTDLKFDGRRILVVDDSEDNQALMTIFLKKTGVTIETAENGKVAVELALSDEFDVILMDIEMPVMNGIAATRELRTKNYKGSIIALTAHAMTEFQKTAKEAGFSDHIAKPISRDRLFEALDQALSARQNA